MMSKTDTASKVRRKRRKYADDERPFACTYCKRTYAFELSRDQHIRLKHIKYQPRLRAISRSVLISGSKAVNSPPAIVTTASKDMILVPLNQYQTETSLKAFSTWPEASVLNQHGHQDQITQQQCDSSHLQITNQLSLNQPIHSLEGMESGIMHTDCLEFLPHSNGSDAKCDVDSVVSLNIDRSANNERGAFCVSEPSVWGQTFSESADQNTGLESLINQTDISQHQSCAQRRHSAPTLTQQPMNITCNLSLSADSGKTEGKAEPVCRTGAATEPLNSDLEKILNTVGQPKRRFQSGMAYVPPEVPEYYKRSSWSHGTSIDSSRSISASPAKVCDRSGCDMHLPLTRTDQPHSWKIQPTAELAAETDLPAKTNLHAFEALLGELFAQSTSVIEDKHTTQVVMTEANNNLSLTNLGQGRHVQECGSSHNTLEVDLNLLQQQLVLAQGRRHTAVTNQGNEASSGSDGSQASTRYSRSTASSNHAHVHRHRVQSSGVPQQAAVINSATQWHNLNLQNTDRYTSEFYNPFVNQYTTNSLT